MEPPSIKLDAPKDPSVSAEVAPAMASAAPVVPAPSVPDPSAPKFEFPSFAPAIVTESAGPTTAAATVLEEEKEIGRKRTRDEAKTEEVGTVDLYPPAQFHFEVSTPTIQSTLESTLPTSTAAEKRLIDIVKNKPRSRVQTLAERLGIAGSQVARVLKGVQIGIQEGMLEGTEFTAVPNENLVTEGYDAAYKLYETRRRAEQLKNVKAMEDYNETEAEVQQSIARDQARLSEMIKGIDKEMDRRKIDKPSDWRLTPEQTSQARARLDKHRAMAQRETETVMGTDDPALNSQITAQRAEILQKAEKKGKPDFSFVTSQEANESLKRAAAYVKKPWWQASTSQYSQADLRKVQKDQTMGRVLLTMIARQRNRTVQRQKVRLVGDLKKYSLVSQIVGTVERSLHTKGFDTLTPAQLNAIKNEYEAISTQPTVWESRTEGYQKAVSLLPQIKNAIAKFTQPGVAPSQIAEAFVKTGSASGRPEKRRGRGMKKPRKTSKRRKKKAKTPKKTAPEPKKEKPAPKTAKTLFNELCDRLYVPFATSPAFEHLIVTVLPLSSIDPFLRASVDEFSKAPHFVEKTLLFKTFTVGDLAALNPFGIISLAFRGTIGVFGPRCTIGTISSYDSGLSTTYRASYDPIPRSSGLTGTSAGITPTTGPPIGAAAEIGRASCRERG